MKLITCTQMIFSSVGDAKLIDFDLTDKVSELYPQGYNHFEERHPDAIEWQGREIIHDRHSLIHIIIDNVKLTDKEKSRNKQFISTSRYFYNELSVLCKICC